MNRWTMRDLEKTDDLDFAVCILNERKADLNAYSPLSVKLSRAISTIQSIKAERDKYMARLVEERDKFLEAITGERSTRNMTEEEYMAHNVEQTRRALMQLIAKVEMPDGDPLSEILVNAVNSVEALQEELHAEGAEIEDPEPCEPCEPTQPECGACEFAEVDEE